MYECGQNNNNENRKRESVLDPRIPDLGFAFVDEMKILGFEIDAKIENLERNFDKCITKMRKTIGNWSWFRLSLPGRIAIVKSLVLSQVTCAAHIGMGGVKIKKEPRQRDGYVYRIS
jgi:hypothetical protein